MRYLTLLYGDENVPADQPGSPEFEAVIAAYGRFDEIAGDAAVAGEALQPTPTAVTVRSGTGGLDSPPLVTSGPFAETTEAIGGFYVLEAESLDEAIELARQIPAATTDHEWVELRPVVEQWEAESGSTTAEGDRYMAIIYGRETGADVPDTPEWQQGAAAHGRFIERHGKALLAGMALHPADTTTTVRSRGGELHVTDGPFAETAEVVGGIYLLRAASRDDAVAVARDIPTNPGGAVELRPIMELGD
jgi:hypothetical protein